MRKAFYRYYEVLFFLFLIGYTIFFNNHLFYYDEPYYLQNVQLLNEHGFGTFFLKNMHGPAGPLHAIIFWLLQGITGNTVVGVRCVNIFFLFGILLIIKSLYYRLNNPVNNPSIFLGMMCIPMVYVSTGMALTEIPALFMLALSLYFLFNAPTKALHITWILSGLFLSFAIAGRQPYLLLLFSYGFWFFYKTGKQLKYIGLCLFFASMIIVPSILFVAWKGIVPHLGGDIANKNSINFSFLLLGLGYSFIVVLFLDRKFFVELRIKHIKYYALLFVLSFFVCFWLQLKQPLMMTLAFTLLPEGLFNLYGILVASILMLAGVFFFISAMKQIITSLDNPARVFTLVSLLILVLSCAKINHQFSSRYVFQAAIFFVLSMENRMPDNKQRFLSIVGAFIGMASLLSYYK